MSSISELKFSDFSFLQNDGEIKVYQNEDKNYRLYTIQKSQNQYEFVTNIAKTYLKHQKHISDLAFTPETMHLEPIQKVFDGLNKMSGIPPEAFQLFLQKVGPKFSNQNILPRYTLNIRTGLQNALEKLTRENKLTKENFKEASKQYILLSKLCNEASWLPVEGMNLTPKTEQILETCNEVFINLDPYKEIGKEPIIIDYRH